MEEIIISIIRAEITAAEAAFEMNPLRDFEVSFWIYRDVQGNKSTQKVPTLETAEKEQPSKNAVFSRV